MRNVHCLFEQSGTFKNEFIKLGFNAYDYDIQNEFGQTDYVIDLFKEIRNAYKGETSIFDMITKNDLIIAFFPCTRFNAMIPLWFRGQAKQQKNWDDIKKLEYSMKLHDELHELYELISMLVVAEKRGLKMIIENPYTQPHYLTNYWCIMPSIIDKDRHANGDFFKKPTQYWFINCEPQNNLISDCVNTVPKKVIGSVKKGEHSVQTQRSMISSQYAERFIKQFIIKRYRYDKE